MQISDLVIQWKAAAASYLPEALNITAIVLIIATAVLLSIFMALLLKTKQKIKLTKSNLKTAEVLCWKCKQKNTSTAKFCRACGAKLLSTASAPISVACPKCGASNSSTARFCRKCGKPLK